MDDKTVAEAKRLGIEDAAKVIVHKHYGLEWEKVRPEMREHFIRIADEAVTAAMLTSIAEAAMPYEEDVLAKRYWEVRLLFWLADAITNIAIVIHDSGLRLGRTLKGH